VAHSRTYTIRGKHATGASHTKLQLASYDPTVQYQIVEFKIMPASVGAPSSGPDVCDCNGILTLNRQDSIDPLEPNFERQTELAWARYSVSDSNNPPSPGVDNNVGLYNSEIVDDRWFNNSIWCHTQDRLGNVEVNYFVRILKIKTTEVAGSISSMRQYTASR
jgi:hypothetical protein